jgi:hypothetical protein
MWMFAADGWLSMFPIPVLEETFGKFGQSGTRKGTIPGLEEDNF